MKTLANALLEMAGFLELSDSLTVDEDSAVAMLDALAFQLQSASPQEKDALRTAAAALSRKSSGAARKFYGSFMSASGLDDSKRVAVPRLKKRTPADQRELLKQLDDDMGDAVVVKRLIEANPALVNAKLDSSGDRPLHCAALYGYKEIVRLLLASGADVRARNRHADTALHNAILNNHKKIVEWLLAAGADLRMKDAQGETPLQLAEKMGRRAIADLLRKAAGKKSAKGKALK